VILLLVRQFGSDPQEALAGAFAVMKKTGKDLLLYTLQENVFGSGIQIYSRQKTFF
jgi:hypothetical protein